MWKLWIDSFPLLLETTVKATIPLALISFVLALIIGAITSLVRFKNIPIFSQIAAVYVWIFRGTPLLVQLFIVFYGFPKGGLSLSAWPAAILTLSLNTGAYSSEAMRAALSSIPRGQWEAGQTLNLTRGQILWKIISPQALRIGLPPLTNDFIDLVKGTSLVSTITIMELFQTGQLIASRTFEPLTMYLEVAAFYLILTTALTYVQNRLEKHSSLYVQQ